MIEIKKISKSFNEKTVLDKIELVFRQGQTHVLLGSSGCGKSTLLRILMGLIPADSGQVIINGETVSFPPTPEFCQKIGYVIQDGGLFPHMTANENVTLMAKTKDWPPEKIRSRLKELSDLVGFDESVLRKLPSELSGGQRQRVSLIRSLMLDPSVLLLDEPLGALDPIVRASLQEELKKTFNALKKTVVIVTHDIGEAAYFGHSITLLNDGSVMQHGTFEELVSHPSNSFVTDFIHAQRPPPQLRDLK